MHVAQVLRWWRQAVPLSGGQVPTLMQPAETHQLDNGEEIEVHRDHGGSYRVILVRRKGQVEEVRGLP